MIILVNGITDSYTRTVGQLTEPIRSEHGIVTLRHAWKGGHFWNVRWRIKKEARELADRVRVIQELNAGKIQIDVCVHSAGSLILLKALKMGMECNNLYFIAPACSRAPGFKRILNRFENAYCWHNCRDRAVLAGAVFLPFLHPFGLAGVMGFKTKGLRGKVQNIRVDSDVGPFNHSENWFTEPGLSSLAGQIAKRAG